MLMFEANGIPYSLSGPDYYCMVEDGKILRLVPKSISKGILEYQRGVVIPASLREKLEVLVTVKKTQPTRRSERLVRW
jgi:hypothetical protein